MVSPTYSGGFSGFIFILVARRCVVAKRIVCSDSHGPFLWYDFVWDSRFGIGKKISETFNPR